MMQQMSVYRGIGVLTLYVIVNQCAEAALSPGALAPNDIQG